MADHRAPTGDIRRMALWLRAYWLTVLLAALILITVAVIVSVILHGLTTLSLWAGLISTFLAVFITSWQHTAEDAIDTPEAW